jgi:hypothetical protein
MIANVYQAVANAADCFKAMTKPISGDFGSGNAVNETLQSRCDGIRESSRDTNGFIRDFGDVIKCTVTLIPRSW